MFQGYTDGTFEFFMALRFNNNTDFFHANHDWYTRDLREPSLALAAALSDVIEEIDERLERRPNRVVSRINRDLRFSNDKTPYRDYLWLAFRPPHERYESTMCLWFDISAREGANYGMSFYDYSRPMMNALRRELTLRPSAFLDAWLPVSAEFETHGANYKRMNVPDGLDARLTRFYTAKDFWLRKHIEDESIVKSPALADEIIGGFRRLKPLYQYLAALTPLEDEDNTVEHKETKA